MLQRSTWSKGDDVGTKPKAPTVMAAPNVIPMADVMLVLLIIFMIITPLLANGQAVNMAAAENAQKMPDAAKDDAVIVAVTRDGRFWLSPGNRAIEPGQIGDQVKELLSDRIDKTVYVRSDSRARFRDVLKTVDEVRAAGVDSIGLLTEKLPPHTPPSPPGGLLR
jgi:biopolymer transport protein ExbD